MQDSQVLILLCRFGWDDVNCILPTLVDTVESFVNQYELLVHDESRVSGWSSRVGIDAQWYPDQLITLHLPAEAIDVLECLDTLIHWEVFSVDLNIPRADQEWPSKVVTCGMLSERTISQRFIRLSLYFFLESCHVRIGNLFFACQCKSWRYALDEEGKLPRCVAICPRCYNSRRICRKGHPMEPKQLLGIAHLIFLRNKWAQALGKAPIFRE